MHQISKDTAVETFYNKDCKEIKLKREKPIYIYIYMYRYKEGGRNMTIF